MLSTHEFARSVERNVEAAFWLIGSAWDGVDVLESDEVRRFVTGIRHPLANVVVRTRIERCNAEDLVGEVLEDYKERGFPACWFVGPSSMPENLGEILEGAGCSRLVDSPGMVADLMEFGGVHVVHSTVQAREVLDLETLNLWGSTLAASFSLSSEMTEFFTNVPKKHGIGPGSPMRLFMAYLDGEAAAVSAMFLSDGVAGLYCVGTRPEFQRRGLGSAVTELAMLEAKVLGCEYAILQSSSAGLKVYERLGFREVCMFQRYSYGLESMEA